MSNTGKRLERLVQQIERHFLPKNFTVRTNEQILNDEGIQIAEFDIEIEGKFGTTNIEWLIECRDRPSAGPAPGSWIEQLVGRRDRFGFNKVTAVSTTGFSNGAVAYARDAGIELRTVKEITFEEISDWFPITHITLLIRYGDLNSAILVIDPAESKEKKESFVSKVNDIGVDMPILISRKTGKNVSPAKAFLAISSQHPEFYNGIKPGEDTREIRVKAEYPNDADHFFIATDHGDIRIIKIIFEASLYIVADKIPFSKIIRYAKDEENEEIASIVEFNFDIEEEEYGMEFHKLAETGETRLLIRKKSL